MSGQLLGAEEIDALRPIIAQGPAPRALIVGVYLASDRSLVDDIVARVDEASCWSLAQRWVALGGSPPTPRVAAVTARSTKQQRGKFELLNELLADEDVGQYDYVVTVDDDIVLPVGFFDSFLGLQTRLGFALAQPARTSNSYVDHPIVRQQTTALGRQTLFVEIGPVTSFGKAVHHVMLPFDLTSPMGWGYENVWAYEIGRRNLKMGIIDATPIDHSIRAPFSRYSWDDADAQRWAYLRKRAHLSDERCRSTLTIARLDGEIDVIMKPPRRWFHRIPGNATIKARRVAGRLRRLKRS